MIFYYLFIIICYGKRKLFLKMIYLRHMHSMHVTEGNHQSSFVASRVLSRRNSTHITQKQQSKEHGKEQYTDTLQTVPTNQPRRNAGNVEDRIIFGTGSGSGVKASQVDTRFNLQRQPRPNRTCTGVFVTRLNPRTTTRQLELHVRNATGHTVRVEKLNARFNTYSSFYIRADRRMRGTLLDASVWPKGCMIKPYFE
jgi:hypothetical protein